MMRTLTLEAAHEWRFSLSRETTTLDSEGLQISELDDIDNLVKTYRARILRFVTFSTGDTDLAETITQDCFLKAYTVRDTFRGDCSVHTWLTSIALNLVRDHQRTRKLQFWKQVHATAININDVAYLVSDDQSSVEAQLIAIDYVFGVLGDLESV